MKIRIKVIRISVYQDLIDRYEIYQKNPCCMKLNDEFIIDKLVRPDNFCEVAFEILYPFLKNLFEHGEEIFPNWMKNKNSYMISCNDGFRPVSFLLEVIDEKNS